jgi:hypothetical protein
MDDPSDGSAQRRLPADYHSILARAIASLDVDTDEARNSIFERSRQALHSVLRSGDPPFSEREIAVEQRALEHAIGRVRHGVAAAPSRSPERLPSDESDDLAFVRAVFRTRHGHVAHLKDDSALVAVEGGIERFGSLEDVREAYGDQGMWTEIQDSDERRKFLTSARPALRGAIASSEAVASPTDVQSDTTAYSMDRLEDQHRAVSPFIRLFSVYCQFASAIAILAVPVFAVLSIVRPWEVEILALSLIVAIPFALMIVFLAAHAVIGMLTIASAIVLFMIVTIHAVGSSGLFTSASRIFLASSSGRVSSLSAFLAIVCVLAGIAFLAYLYARALIAASTMSRLSPDDRAVLRPLSGGVTFLGKAWSRLRSLPPAFEFVGSRPRAVLIGVLAQISAFFLAVAGILFFSMPIRFNGAANTIARSCWYEPVASVQDACALGAVAGVSLIAVVIVPLLFAAGAGLQRIVQRLLRFSLEQLQRADPRRPVLFLRAFKDDQIELPPAKVTFLGWLMEYGNRRTNFDRVLLDEGTPYGPVVAVGNPVDELPPYGAARGYFDDKTWQQAVSALAHDAIAIMICVDDTEGVWWEVNHLATNNLHAKVLFIIHPRHAPRERNAALLIRLSKALGRDLSELATRWKGKSTLGFFFDVNGKIKVVASSTFSHVALMLTLRLFLRSKLGVKPIPLPRA